MRASRTSCRPPTAARQFGQRHARLLRRGLRQRHRRPPRRHQDDHPRRRRAGGFHGGRRAAERGPGGEEGGVRPRRQHSAEGDRAWPLRAADRGAVAALERRERCARTRIPASMTSALTTVARGDGSLIADPHRTIVRDPASWRALWAAHAGPEAPAPAVDFSAVVVAAAFAGERPSAGFQIEIRPGLWEGRRRLLEVVESQPAPGPSPRSDRRRSTSSLPRATMRRSAIRASILRDPSPPVPAPYARRVPQCQIPRPASSSGCGLAYLAGPFSGADPACQRRSAGQFHARSRSSGWEDGAVALGLLAAALPAVVPPFLFTLLLACRRRRGALGRRVSIAVVTPAAAARGRCPRRGALAEKRSRLLTPTSHPRASAARDVRGVVLAVPRVTWSS